MRGMRAKYVLYPRKNPFQAVTVLHPPGNREGWYSANAFVYAVQGTCEPSISRPESITQDVGGEQEAACGMKDTVIDRPNQQQNQETREGSHVTSQHLEESLDLYLPD